MIDYSLLSQVATHRERVPYYHDWNYRATVSVSVFLAVVPPPIIRKTNSASQCIPPFSTEEREKVTARCFAPTGSVVWLMG